MDNDPVVFTSTSNPRSPALLRYPEAADPGLIIGQFPAGTFTWSERYGCPTFDAAKKTAVISALFKDFTYVRVQEGKSERELDYE
ncbi:hypothetical protein ACWEOX_22650, partial [Streptomyces sp. NPDC004314]